MGRWPTIRRNKSLRPPSPSPSLQAKENRGADPANLTAVMTGSNTGIQVAGMTQPRLQTSASQDSVGRDESSLHDACAEDDDGTVRYTQLTPTHKAAIRAIRKVKLKTRREISPEFRHGLI